MPPPLHSDRDARFQSQSNTFLSIVPSLMLLGGKPDHPFSQGRTPSLTDLFPMFPCSLSHTLCISWPIPVLSFITQYPVLCSSDFLLFHPHLVSSHHHFHVIIEWHKVLQGMMLVLFRLNWIIILGNYPQTLPVCKRKAKFCRQYIKHNNMLFG